MVFFRALDGWRGVATHLSRFPQEVDQKEREYILQAIPSEFRSSQATGSAGRWVADPLDCGPGMRRGGG